MLDILVNRPYMLVFYLIIFLAFTFCLWKTKSYVATIICLLLQAVWFTFMLLLGCSLAELLLTLIPFLLLVMIQTIVKEKKQ